MSCLTVQRYNIKHIQTDAGEAHLHMFQYQKSRSRQRAIQAILSQLLSTEQQSVTGKHPQEWKYCTSNAAPKCILYKRRKAEP